MEWRPAREWNPTVEEIRYWARTPETWLTDEDEEYALVTEASYPQLLIELAHDPHTVKGDVIAEAFRTVERRRAADFLGEREHDDGERTMLANRLSGIAVQLSDAPPACAAASRYLQRLADLLTLGVRETRDALVAAIDLASDPLSTIELQVERRGPITWVMTPDSGGMRRRTAFDLASGAIWTRHGPWSSELTDNAPPWASRATR